MHVPSLRHQLTLYRHTEAGKRLHSAPQFCGQLVFDKGTRSISGEENHLPTNGAETADVHMRKNEVGPQTHTIEQNELQMEQ